VLHPGRAWAMLPKLVDARPTQQIIDEVAAHFAVNPPFRDRDQIIELFMEAFRQDPLAAAAPVQDDEVSPDEVTNEDDTAS
jgi:hypothetical protein